MDLTIGCILLESPFFFRRDDWILFSDWQNSVALSTVASQSIKDHGILFTANILSGVYSTFSSASIGYTVHPL